MLKTQLFIFLLLFASAAHSQIINGKVYDAESTVKGVKITNISTRIITNSDQNGDFRLQATVNDSLVFESLFHHPLKIAVKPSFFEDVYVFELKKLVNELDEILLSEEKSKVKPFEEETYNLKLNEIIQTDIKENPHLYGRAPSYGLDFIQVIGLVAKLFKKKKSKREIDSNITYDQLVKLFESHVFFNTELLEVDLSIPKDNTLLFMEFCEARGIKKSLMKESKRFQLLDVFVLYSQEFLVILEDYKALKTD
ncbi:hypothetical protein [Winogradskyella sp. A3E31]|uniref:hypothetical protein n=1 Tax=Winogradskyella sp. A3E31 TaxID=3349637 RepID=UPI00398A5F83